MSSEADFLRFLLYMGGFYLLVWLYASAVHRMNSAIAVGIPAICMGVIFLGLGIYGKFFPYFVISLLPLLMGSYMLYKGIPLELRERRYRARRRRWEKLDEEESERVK